MRKFNAFDRCKECFRASIGCCWCRFVQRWYISGLHIWGGGIVHMGCRNTRRRTKFHNDGHVRRPIRYGGFPEFAVETLEASLCYKNVSYTAHLLLGLLQWHSRLDRHERYIECGHVTAAAVCCDSNHCIYIKRRYNGRICQWHIVQSSCTNSAYCSYGLGYIFHWKSCSKSWSWMGIDRTSQ